MHYSVTKPLPDLFGLVEALINRPSVTPDDAGCQAQIQAWLTPFGFRFQDLSAHDTTNLWAQWGEGAPLLVFAGHTDVVPSGPADAWKAPPFSWYTENGIGYGRGAVDMKGAIAAMIHAITHFISTHPQIPGSIGLLLTSDEEGAATHGTQVALEKLLAQQVRPTDCIIGEPSSHHRVGDTIKVGRRGSLNGIVTLIGQQGHIAYPEHTCNPAHALGPFLQALLETDWGSGDPDFPPAVLQISNIQAGTGAHNVVPGTLKLIWNLRFPPPWTPADFQSRIAACCAHAETIARQTLPGIRHTLEWASQSVPFVTHDRALRDGLAASIARVCGEAPVQGTQGGTSDGKFFAAHQIPVVELGLSHISAHQINEHVPLAELTRLADLYSAFLADYFIHHPFRLAPPRP